MHKIFKTIFLFLLLSGMCLAGTNKVLDLVLSGDFASADPWEGEDEWVVVAGVVDWISDEGDDTLSQPTIKLVEGATYKVYVTVTNTVLDAGDTYIAIQLGGGTDYQFTKDQTFDAAAPLYLVCGNSPSNGLEFTAVNGTAGDTMTLDDVAAIVEQFKPSTNLDVIFVAGNIRVPDGGGGEATGPIDEYLWDSGVDYSSGAEPLGIWNGERVYKSVDTHADGAGGSDVNYYIFNRTSGNIWLINAGSPLDDGSSGTRPLWSKTVSIIGDYTPSTSGAPIAIGIAAITYGPTDHSVPSQGGTAGLLTDGSAGFINLSTSYDYLNSLRGGKFAILSILNTNSTLGHAQARYHSAETLANMGYHFRLAGSDAQLRFSGVQEAKLATPIQDRELFLTGSVYDAIVGDAYFFYNGSISKDTFASGFDLVPSTLLSLGQAAYSNTLRAYAQYGFTAILDLTSVVTVDQSWAIGLSVAINNAATRDLCDPDLIAAAIFAYDSDIDGFYFSINELASGDASDYYLLAKDIPTQTEQTESFYGLVSPSGVEGAVIKSAIPRFRRRMRNRQ